VLKTLASLPNNVRQYLLITGNYWVFTLTDGALRMLVVLHFYQLGYSPLDIALLFLFYELFGVITNLLGGWLGSHFGLNKTMNVGLLLQIIALSMLLVPSSMLSVVWVMAAQALSGIAKDLNKMSAKSAVKSLLPADAQGQLFKWVAILTGSKNTLKGVGFFLGGALLTLLGFKLAVLAMVIALLIVWLFSLISLQPDLGKAKNKAKFSEIFSKSPAINALSAARLFLFGARDVWFVVALPVFLSSQFGWAHWTVGAFLALWVIGYGVVQALAPKLIGRKQHPDGKAAFNWGLSLSIVPVLIAVAMATDFHLQSSIVLGLVIFALVFAINSAVHSFLIVDYASEDGVSLDVGFYYMANAMGRLIGTVLSGWLFQQYGLISCLVSSSVFVLIAALISRKLPKHPQQT
jgi:predicted MFS family arabinose efflux permease